MEFYGYVICMVIYDMDVVWNYVIEIVCNYIMKMYDVVGGYYQVGYVSCLGIIGFNIILLNVFEVGIMVKVNFVGLVVGCVLVEEDLGMILDVDGNVVGMVIVYNNNGGNMVVGW